MKKVYFLDKGHLYMFERRGARARSAERAKILEEGIGSERGMRGFQGGASGKEPACQCRRHKRCRFDPWVGKIPLEKGMATHSTILVWRIPWTEESGNL